MLTRWGVVVAAAAVLSASVPSAAVAALRVQVTADMAASGVATVQGRVVPSKTSWAVRVQERVARPRRGRSVRVWVTRADSARLGRSGRFKVTLSPRGNSITLRVLVRSRGRVIARSRTVAVYRPAQGPGSVPTEAAGAATASPEAGAAPGGSPSVPPPGSPAALKAVLRSGEGLAPGETLVSPNRQYRLVMQEGDGNLVLYRGSTALWAAGPAGAGARAVMQGDGNLVVYAGSSTKWSSRTDGFAGANLALQDDGNLVVSHAGRAVWSWSSGYVGHALGGGQTLSPGGIVRSPSGRFRMVMQGDGNLVLYRDATALWSSGIAGSGARAVMQGDGNLVVYKGATARWASTTDGFPGANLVVQDDGNAVLYHSGRGIWAWGPGYLGDRLQAGNTLPPGAYLKSGDHRYSLHMQGDGNLVQYGPSGVVWAWDTAGNPGAHAVMQGDGNFVVYRGATALRATDTSGRPGAFIILQNDDNLVVYLGGTALWSRKQSATHPAAAWAAAQLGKRVADPSDAALFSDWPPGPYGEWSGDCAKFAYVAWYRAGKSIARGNARDQYNAYASRVQGGPAPAGALVFWPNVAAPFGHIAISDGAGGVYTTQGLDHANLPVARLPVGHFGTPAGWVMP